jgi:hypothetical protein
MSQVLFSDRTLEIKQLSESTIRVGAWYNIVMRRLGDGRLYTRGEKWAPDWIANGGPCYCISDDQGASWQPCAAPTEGKDYSRIANYLFNQRRDGSILGWTIEYNTSVKYQGRPGQPTEQVLMRAAGWDALVAGQSQETTLQLSLPYLVPLVGDDFVERYAPVIWGRMVEADHGYLLQACYQNFFYDRQPRLWAEQSQPAVQSRSCVLYSWDDGNSWHYLSTIAAPAQYPLPAQGEGYCEPDILYFGDGHLLSVLRSGGNPGGVLSERMTPLVATHSWDGGISWSPPVPISAYGVAPALLQMSNGLTVCLSGRPGFFLLLSADQGRTWSTPLWLSESDGSFGHSSSGYGALIEMEPGVLGVTFDEYCGEGDDKAMTAKFRQYQMPDV